MGDVSAQLLTGLVSSEVPLEQVRPLGQVIGWDGGSGFCSGGCGRGGGGLYDGADDRPVGPHTMPLQHHLIPSIPVGSIGVLEDVLNHDGQILPPDGQSVTGVGQARSSVLILIPWTTGTLR